MQTEQTVVTDNGSASQREVGQRDNVQCTVSGERERMAAVPEK